MRATIGHVSPTDDDPLLAEIKHRIVEALHPERVILFGSRARGEAREGSDVDLLVVADTEDSPWRYGARVRKALRGLPLTKDVVVFTPEEFAVRSKWLSGVARRAAEEGVVLYEVDEAA